MSKLKNKLSPFKTIFLAGVFVGSLYLGDRYEPFTKAKEQAFYHNSSIEDGYYQNPTNLDIVTIRNKKNRIEVYLVDEQKQDSLPIQENMHVGTAGENIDDFFDAKKDNLKNWWETQNTDSTKLVYKIKELF